MSKNSESHELMNLITTSENSNSIVYPFINELVDSLFNSDLNSLISKNTEINSDKSVFMMFVNIYFMAYLHTQSQNNEMSDKDKKKILKQMLSEVIHNPEKRKVCVSLIKQINPLFNMDSIIENTIKNPDSEIDNLLEE